MLRIVRPSNLRPAAGKESEEDHSPSSLGVVDKDKQGGAMGHASAMAFPGSILPMIPRVSKAPCFTSVASSLFEGSTPTIQKRLQHNSLNISRTPSPSVPAQVKPSADGLRHGVALDYAYVSLWPTVISVPGSDLLELYIQLLNDIGNGIGAAWSLRPSPDCARMFYLRLSRRDLLIPCPNAIQGRVKLCIC